MIIAQPEMGVGTCDLGEGLKELIIENDTMNPALAALV